ncbi:hypothetical protein [Streptomyces sp. TLI_185]|uniref:hypothetical protein n=1 Tax=Streptomyces sp. TLI_185 TaxID=2485151 RepID=UPI000F4F11E3|nr:hypothetical protein [Streptomyces sp. TLI_185]
MTVAVSEAGAVLGPGDVPDGGDEQADRRLLLRLIGTVGFVDESRQQHLDTSLGSTRSTAEIEQFMASGCRGPLPSWQGPAARTAEERWDLPSTSSILANLAYRLLMAWRPGLTSGAG